RTDLWSLGAVLYWLLSGNPPFKTAGESRLTALLARMKGGVPDPLPTSVPEEVRALVFKALECDVARRFQTAAEMQRAIEAAARKLPPVTSEEIGRFLRDHLKKRMERRKGAVQRALAASQERAAGKVRLQRPLVPGHGASFDEGATPESNGS